MSEQMSLVSVWDLPDSVLRASRAVLNANGRDRVALGRWAQTSYYAQNFWPTFTLRGQYEGARSQMQDAALELREWLRAKGDPPENTHWIELAMRDAVLAHPPEYWVDYREARGWHD